MQTSAVAFVAAADTVNSPAAVGSPLTTSDTPYCLAFAQSGSPRTLRTSADRLQAARLVPLAPDGAELAFDRCEARPESLRAECAAGAWEFVFADPATILARADRPGLGLRLDFLSDGIRFQTLFPVPARGSGAPPDGTLRAACR